VSLLASPMRGNDIAVLCMVVWPVLRCGAAHGHVMSAPPQGPQHLPAPTDDSVAVKQQPGGHHACVTFSGVADEGQVASGHCCTATALTGCTISFGARSLTSHPCNSQVQQQLQRLRLAARKHDLKLKSPSDYIVARYNDPSTKPIFRRNEVLVELEDFKLW
jgi:SOUL heme-binding protein